MQVLDSDWFKTDDTAVFAVLTLKTKMRYTMRSDVNLRGWNRTIPGVAAEPLTDWGNWDVVALLLNQGNSKSKQKTGNQGDDCDRARAQISPVEEEERRAA